MRMLRTLSIAAVTYGVSLFGSTAFAQNAADLAVANKMVSPLAVPTPNCGPGIDAALRGPYATQYRTLLAAIAPNTVDLAQLLDSVDNAANL